LPRVVVISKGDSSHIIEDAEDVDPEEEVDSEADDSLVDFGQQLDQI